MTGDGAYWIESLPSGFQFRFMVTNGNHEEKFYSLVGAMECCADFNQPHSSRCKEEQA